MKNYLFAILVAFVSNSAWSQATSQLTITPFNPTPSDTILVISALSYSGNCSYGLVYTNTTVTGNTITIMPTYCGHGLSTTCFSTDTFKIAPLAIGNYVLKIEYHQGSICPISNFDATIGEAVAAISVNTIVTTGLKDLKDLNENLMIYPNPAKDRVTVEVLGGLPGSANLIGIRNILGEVLIRQGLETRSADIIISSLPPGIYTLELESDGRLVATSRLLISD